MIDTAVAVLLWLLVGWLILSTFVTLSIIAWVALKMAWGKPNR